MCSTLKNTSNFLFENCVKRCVFKVSMKGFGLDGYRGLVTHTPVSSAPAPISQC